MSDKVDRKEMEEELEKIIGKSVRSLLQNNREIIDKMVVEITKNEVRKVLEDILGASIRKRVTDIIYSYRDKMVENSQTTLLVTEGGDSDLKEVDAVAEHTVELEEQLERGETLFPKSDKPKRNKQHQ